nr:ribosome biogenesis protein WDR12 homolog [Ipomoea batatas]
MPPPRRLLPSTATLPCHHDASTAVPPQPPTRTLTPSNRPRPKGKGSKWLLEDSSSQWLPENRSKASHTTEKILDIEYIKAVAPRREEEPSLHDHWVSAVDGSNSK